MILAAGENKALFLNKIWRFSARRQTECPARRRRVVVNS
jgi:hypothetical protein